MKRVTMALMVVATLAGCRQPTTDEQVEEAPVKSDPDEFSSMDWENLTGDLLAAGHEGNVEKFKALLAPETIELYEATWEDLTARSEKALEYDGLAPGDRKKLEALVNNSNWATLVSRYRPGRLVTITPVEEGKYRVNEVMGGGRKVDYHVVREGESWLVLYDEDSKSFQQLVDFLDSSLGKILERNGLEMDGSRPAPPVVEQDAGTETVAGP